MNTMIGRFGAIRPSTRSPSRICWMTSMPGHVGQREVEDQEVGMVEPTEPERVGAARRREHVETVLDEVLAEQVEGRLVSVADDDGRDLIYRRHGLPPGDPW
jgi:hypothetical protein